MTDIRYTGSRLDRVSKLRHDVDWVSAAFVGDDARALVLSGDRNLVAGLSDEGGGAARPVSPSAPLSVSPAAALLPLSLLRDRLPVDSFSWALLGLDGQTPIFAVDLPAGTEDGVPEIAEAGEFVDIRRVGSLVSAEDAAMLAYARAILAWHRRNRFCGVCGSPMDSRQAGHVRRCRNPDCATDVFPRTDPVVIALVTSRREHDDVERCLLGRHTRLPRGVYSCLAGFVEPGESLEEAVAREIREEAGVEVRDVRYRGAQPWPFPYSMMIGFRATAVGEDIVLDDDELDDAQWFTAAEVATFGEWEDETAQFRLPRRDSIARQLVESWIEEIKTTE